MRLSEGGGGELEGCEEGPGSDSILEDVEQESHTRQRQERGRRAGIQENDKHVSATTATLSSQMRLCGCTRDAWWRAVGPRAPLPGHLLQCEPLHGKGPLRVDPGAQRATLGASRSPRA